MRAVARDTILLTYFYLLTVSLTYLLTDSLRDLLTSVTHSPTCSLLNPTASHSSTSTPTPTSRCSTHSTHSTRASPRKKKTAALRLRPDCPPALIRLASARPSSQGGLQPRPASASLGPLAGMFWLAGPTIALFLFWKEPSSPSHLQAPLAGRPRHHRRLPPAGRAHGCA